MEETLITLETAKLLKQLNINVDYLYFYLNGNIQSDIIFKQCKNEDYFFPAPTQSILQKYLREKEYIYDVVIMHKITPSNQVVFYQYKGKIKKDWNDCFETYELVLEHILQQKLNFLYNEKTNNCIK